MAAPNVFLVEELTTDALKSLLKTLAPFVGKDNYDLVRVTADSLSRVMTFRVTNGVRAATASLVTNIQAATPGRCEALIDFAALAAFVGIEESGKDAFQNEDAQIFLALSENGLELRGRGAAGTRKLRLPARSPFDYILPSVEPGEATKTFSFSSATEFAEKLNVAAAAMHNDETRLALCGVCLRYVAAGGVVKLCATDGRRATEVDLEFETMPPHGEEDCDALFSKETVKAVLSALKNAGEKSDLDVVIFRESADAVSGTGYFIFRTKHDAEIEIATPLVNAKYPSLQPIFDAFALPGATAVLVDAAVLTRALEQICKSCPNAGTSGAQVHFEQETDGGLMKISIFDEDERYTATVPGENAFAPLAFPPELAEQKFNPELLAGMLHAFGDGNVCLAVSKHADRQVLITKPNDRARPHDSAQRSIVIGFSQR